MTQPPAEYQVSRSKIIPGWLLILLVAGAGIFFYYRHTHRGLADHSASIQATIGASSCTSSGFYVVSKLTNQRQIIYDCLMPSGNYKCVTEDGGIASDSTAVVKLLFQNTLGASKPTCIG